MNLKASSFPLPRPLKRRGSIMLLLGRSIKLDGASACVCVCTMVLV